MQHYYQEDKNWPNIYIEIESCPTLKQTKSENGRVTMTNAHEIMVSSQPQRPMPGSDSLAEIQISTLVWNRERVIRLSGLDMTVFLLNCQMPPPIINPSQFSCRITMSRSFQSLVSVLRI